MKKVFVLGGLGLNSLIINDIKIKHCNVTFIDWIIPNENDSIQDYCKKLISTYSFNNTIIVGVSFGSVIALGIAKLISIERVILISGLRRIKEIPLIYRIFIRLRIYLVISPRILSTFSFPLRYFFSISKSSDELILKEAIEKTDNTFFKWALENILKIGNGDTTTKIIRIHGNNDRILPLRNTHVDILINQGGHFMIFDKKKEIESALSEAVNL